MKYAFILLWLVSTVVHFRTYDAAESSVRSIIVGVALAILYLVLTAVMGTVRRIVRATLHKN